MIGAVLKGAFAKRNSILKGALSKSNSFGRAFKQRAINAKSGIRNMADDVMASFKPGGRLSAMEFKPGSTKSSYNIQRDIGVKTLKKAGSVASGASRVTGNLSRPLRNKLSKAKGTLATAKTPLRHASKGLFTVGAVGMLGYQVMKGGMEGARDIVHERYMQDYQYSRSVLHNSRVGLSSGTNRMLKYGGHQGLALGLSRTRHGRM